MTGSLHTDAYKRFLNSLVDLRRSCSVSQTELARRLDRPQSWVAKNELGERRMDPIELAQVAAALNVDPAAVFDLAVQASRTA